MAPIKFDDKLRKKLEERTIAPNEMTWNKLNSKLDKLEKRKNNKPFWWLGLAASFVGVLLISNMFFMTNNNNTQPKIVDTETKAETKAEIKKEDLVKAINDEAEVVVYNETQSIQNKTKTIINKTPFKTNKAVQPKASTSINKNYGVNIKTEAVTTNKKGDTDNFETQKINEVIAQIEEIKASKSNVTDAEIDSLLNKAERDIFKRHSKNSVRVVDANSLLFEVENELEQSFRTKVFETIKSGYKTVRTAVVERKNN